MTDATAHPTPNSPRPTSHGSVDAIVLAGGHLKGELADLGVDRQALVPIGGRPMVSYVLDALAEAETVGRVALVCGSDCRAELREMPEGLIFADEREDMLGNVEAGLEALWGEASRARPEAAEWVLLSPCDVPLIRGEIVDRFVRSALDSGAEFCYPVLARSVYDAQFAGTRRTWAKLADGTFTGCNLILASRRFLDASRELVRQVFAARKNPLKLASIIGVSLALKYATGRLAIAEIEARVQRLVGLPARAIQISDPELGVDVDKLSDLELVRQQVKSKK